MAGLLSKPLRGACPAEAAPGSMDAAADALMGCGCGCAAAPLPPCEAAWPGPVGRRMLLMGGGGGGGPGGGGGGAGCTVAMRGGGGSGGGGGGAAGPALEPCFATAPLPAWAEPCCTGCARVCGTAPDAGSSSGDGSDVSIERADIGSQSVVALAVAAAASPPASLVFAPAAAASASDDEDGDARDASLIPPDLGLLGRAASATAREASGPDIGSNCSEQSRTVRLVREGSMNRNRLTAFATRMCRISSVFKWLCDRRASKPARGMR